MSDIGVELVPAILLVVFICWVVWECTEPTARWGHYDWHERAPDQQEDEEGIIAE